MALWMAHARGLHFAGIRQRDFPLYSRLVPVGLAIVAILFASASIDYWTVMRFFGSRGLTLPPDAWKDPVFSRPLVLLPVRFAFLFGSGLVCVCAGDSLRAGLLGHGAGMAVVDAAAGSCRTFDRGAACAAAAGRQPRRLRPHHRRHLVLGFAAWFFLGNYDLLFNSHAFMTGADYVDAKITLPLRWLLIVAVLAALPLAWTSRYKKAAILVGTFFILQLALADDRQRRLRAAE